jgi:hypothetical protein
MFLRDLLDQLPVPACVLKHYGTVAQFVTATRGLNWAGGLLHVTLEPSFHGKLVRAAREADRSREAAALRQPSGAAAAAAAAVGGGGSGGRGGSSKGVEPQQQQQQGKVRDLKRKDRHEPNPQPMKRQAPTPSPAAAAAEAAVQDAYTWLMDLAMYLPPGEGVDTLDLRRDLPVPRTLVKHYGSASRFFKSVPCLFYNGTLHCITLDVAAHRQLREAATAADAAASFSGMGLPFLVGWGCQ